MSDVSASERARAADESTREWGNDLVRQLRATGDRATLRLCAGPWTEAMALGIADLSGWVPESELALRTQLAPPNLLVVGGGVDAAWAVAETVRGIVGGTGSIIGIDTAASTPIELITILTGDIWDENDPGPVSDDVVVLSSLDGPSAAVVPTLAELLAPPRRVGDDAMFARLAASVEAAGERWDPVMPLRFISRSMTIPEEEWEVGGELIPSPFAKAGGMVIVGHTASGRVPAGVGAWGGLVVAPPDTKVCPDCAETVRLAARICRFCRHEFEE